MSFSSSFSSSSSSSGALIVTRHPALIEFLRELGIDGEVIARGDEETVRGRDVYGVLPMHLAAECRQFTEIKLNLRPDQKGRELNLDEVREAFGGLVTYVVAKATADQFQSRISDAAYADGCQVAHGINWKAIAERR